MITIGTQCCIVINLVEISQWPNCTEISRELYIADTTWLHPTYR